MSGLYRIRTDMAVQLVGIIGTTSHEVELDLTFNVSPERSATYLQPGEAATVSVQTAYVVERDGIEVTRHEAPTWLWRMIEADDDLEREMLAEAWEADEYARDQHADTMREERLMERRS